MSGSERIGVRPAGPDDALTLLPMFTAFYGEHLEPKTVEAIRRHIVTAAPVDTVLIAWVHGSPAGFASLRLIPQIETDRPHAELSDIYVDPAFRRRGVGRTLVRAAERRAREAGAPAMVLVVGGDNGIARSFYRGQGYEDFALVMKKPLEGDR